MLALLVVKVGPRARDMKSRTIALVVTLCSIAAFGQTKTAEGQPGWSQQTVQNAFDEVSTGMHYSWTEKWLARLRDRAVPEIMKCALARPFTRQNSETALTLVNMSFADPRSIM